MQPFYIEKKYDVVNMPAISKLNPYSLKSYWTLKFGHFIAYAIFAQKWALPCCVRKIILTEKLCGVGSSNFGFVHLYYNSPYVYLSVCLSVFANCRSRLLLDRLRRCL